MKILSLGSDTNGVNGGMITYQKDFIEHFSQKNNLLMLNISLSDLGEEDKKYQYNPNAKEIVINVIDFFNSSPVDVFKYPPMTKSLILVQEKFKPDIIIVQDWFWVPSVMSVPINCPVIYLCHFFYTYMYRMVGMENPRIEESEKAAIMDVSDIIVANSKFTKKVIDEVYPEARSKVIDMPLGVNKAKIKPSPNLSSKVITYIGRFQGEKGIERLVNDIRQNIDWIINNGFHIYFAGKGGLLEMVIDLSIDYPENITYLGVIGGKDKEQLVMNTKYNINSSEYEPYGLQVNEALASGKIVVASDVGGHKEQIKNNYNGVLVKDGESFIQAIAEIEKNPKLQEKLVMNASKSASDIGLHFAQLEALMRKLGA